MLRLDADAYRRGIVWWDDPSIRVVAMTADAADDEAPRSEWLVPKSGSVVEIPSRGARRIRIVGADGITPATGSYHVRWEFAEDEGIVTLVWTSDGLPPVDLRCVPDFGIYHRLVVATPLLESNDDLVLREGGAVVRIVDGTVDGDHHGAIDPDTISAWETPSPYGSMGRVRLAGRFVETVAPGRTREEAEHAAFALHGYLCVCLGHRAAGRIVFSETREARSEFQECSVQVPIVPRAPQRTTHDVVHARAEAVGVALPKALAAAERSGGLALALRWYQKALQSPTALDWFLSCFVAIEAIVTAHSEQHSPLPVTEARRKRFDDLLAALKRQGVDSDLLADFRGAMGKFVEPSLADRFAFDANQRGLDKADEEAFARLRRTRNDVFHGTTTLMDDHTAAAIRRLLVRMLKIELGVAPLLPWSDGPRVLTAWLHSTRSRTS